MKGRKPKYTKDVLLEKASALFWKKGYSNCSTAELLEAMDINKGTMYHLFQSKENLYVLCLSHLEDAWFAQMNERIESSEKPFGVISDFFNTICREDAETRELGCILGNTLIESYQGHPGLKEVTISYLQDLHKLFERAVYRSVEIGEKQFSQPPKETADLLLNFYNGIQITKRMPYPSDHLAYLVHHQIDQILV